MLSMGTGDRPSRLNRFAVTALGALAIGVIGSGIWDLIARPGLNRVASAISYGVTLGSRYVRDLPYSAAALDPRPLPGMVILYLIIMLPSVAVGVLFSKPKARRLTRKLEMRVELEGERGDVDTRAERMARVYRKELRKLQALLFILIGAVTLFGVVSYNIIDKAMILHRTFESNILILAPHLDDNAEANLRAMFASMDSAEDYVAVRTSMMDAARAAGVSLREETP